VISCLLTEFDQTFTTNGLGAKMKALNFGVKRLKVKVTAGSNALKCTLALLARYLAYLLTEFDQTFTTNGLYGKDDLKFWSQKVEGQGHGRVRYAQNALLTLLA